MVVRGSVGNYTYTGSNISLNCADIGKFCSISYNVNIGETNHEYKTLSTHPFYFGHNMDLLEEVLIENLSLFREDVTIEDIQEILT